MFALSNWIGPRVCVCTCPVSCHQLTLTVLWAVVPPTWPLGPGRAVAGGGGGPLSTTAAQKV